MATRTPIGYVEATVRVPLYEGDKTEGGWDWFVYEEPGINARGHLATCRRPCEVVGANVVLTAHLTTPSKVD